MLTDIIAGTGFVALVATGIACARTPRGVGSASSPRLRVQAFVFLGLGISLLAGLSQISLWPMASWRMMHLRLPADVKIPALLCVDSTGHTFRVDYRAWQPSSEEDLEAWIMGRLAKLSAADQDTARATLLRMAEGSRLRVRQGGTAAASPSPFGRLAASSHLLRPRRWNVASDAPDAPCVALRWVERAWNVQDRAAGRGAIIETTLWEYRPAP